MIELGVEEIQTKLGAVIKVIGVGGAGGNAVNSMITSPDCPEVEFIVANTDAQALALSPVATKIHLGTKITKGLGAGSNPEVGRRAAEEDRDAIIEAIRDADILFLTAGLGGGTGSGGLPVVAALAKELGILTVAIVTKPFTFEGKRRLKHAEDAVKTIRAVVDTLIVVPNQRLLQVVDPKISMLDAFGLSNSVLKQAIKGISDIILRPGLINVDFADVKAVMKDMGMALMGTAFASGENRAEEAARAAISSRLLENVSIEGARGVLINISGAKDLGLHEINAAASVVYELVSEDANIILGSVIDETLGDQIMITVIATGFEQPQEERGFSPLLRSEPVRRETRQPSVQTYVEHEVAKQHVSKSHAQEAASSYNVPRMEEPALTEDSGDYDLNSFDTPAYLRKKNDPEQQR